MDAHNRIIAEGLVVVDRPDGQYLGVDTGIPTNSPSLRKLAGQRRRQGWIVRDRAVESWQPNGFVEHDGKVHVYGPLHRGRFVDSFLSIGPDGEADESTRAATDQSAPPHRWTVDERLEALSRVAAALETLGPEGASIPFHTRAFICLDDGGVLVLPPDIVGAIREHQDYTQRIRRMERFNHPDRKPEENAGFAIAAAAYAIITRAYPFDGEDEEELHARVRAASPVPPAWRDVTIRDDVSQKLVTELTGKEPGMGVGEWVEQLERWRNEGVRVDLGDGERRRREEQARQGVAKIERTFSRKERIRRNGRTAIIVAIIVVVVGTIPATIIRNALAPRATAGLPPEEVVRVFYTSMNTLDHMTMEDAVVDGAGGPFIREVTNLFVIDRQRMSVEMESGFVNAQSWRDAGMPVLSGGRSPYGVANLALESLDAADAERRFEVTYERWLPDYDQAELTGRAGILGIAIVETVALRMDRDDWVIYSIERVSETPLDVNELRDEIEGTQAAEEDAA